MGEPVKIDDMARTMVRLAGLTVRDEVTPEGDIAIVYTGLRPGEKLYEELLIGDGATGTAHPRILRNNEPFLASNDLAPHLDVLRAAVAEGDGAAIEGVLMRIVEGYAPSPGGEPIGRSITAAAPSRMLH
jgi:FlaA1/EpsC-like NDP-sugar epimerase